MKLKLFLSALIATLMVPVSAYAQSGPSDASDKVIVLTLIIGAGIIYILPTFIAFYRKHPNRWPIFAINIVFGGTGLGWLAAIIWAFSAVHKSPTGNHGGESGLNLFLNDTQKVEFVGQIANNEKPTTNATSTDPAEQLLKLKALRDQEAITGDEYNRLRNLALSKFNETAAF